jgi:hypothetical protein
MISPLTSRALNRRMAGAGLTRRGGRGGSGGGVAFNPASLSPYIWIEADSGITQVANRISAWASKVNGINYVQAIGAQQMLYVASDAGYNNLPTARVDGAGVNMPATVSLPLPFSTFEYGQYDSGTYHNTVQTSGANIAALWERSAGNQAHFAFDGVTAASTPTIADAASAKRSLYRGVSAAKSVSLRRNAGAASTAVNNGIAAGPWNVHRLGYASTAQICTVAASFVFTRELTAAEVVSLHAWCVARYG